MPHVAIQAERTRMMEKKEMILILVEAAGSSCDWVPADTIYQMVGEAPELANLPRFQTKAYLYTLRDEGKLALKFEHGKFACQVAERAKALNLLKPTDECNYHKDIGPIKPVKHNFEPVEAKRVRPSKPPAESARTRESFRGFLTEFVGAEEISVSALRMEAVRRGFGSSNSINSMLSVLREHGFLMKDLRGVVKLVNPPTTPATASSSDPEPQPDPPAEAEEVTAEVPMRELKATWQIALQLVREIAVHGQISTSAFVAEGIKRNLGNEGSLRQYIPRLCEKGHLTKVSKGHYKITPDQSVIAGSEPASAPEAPSPAPVVDPPADQSTTEHPSAEPEAPRGEDPFEKASSMLANLNGGGSEVTRAIARAHRIAAVLQGIPEEHWDHALAFARELARAGK